jgi:tetratricopeptide (TPR) repeat protein
MRMRANRIVLCAVIAASSVASAQYRPPPLTEAQQLVRDADTARTEAAAADAKGDRKSAESGYRQAADLYAKALKLDNQLQQAASGLGATLNTLKEYARTVELVRAFADAHPDALDVQLPVGVALVKVQRGAEGAPYLDRVIAANDPQYFMARYYRGLYALQVNDGTKAVDELTAFLSQRPSELAKGDAPIYELIGRAELIRRRPNEARAAYEKAQKGRPESITVQLGLASVFELEGRPDKAIALVDGLAKRQPKSVEVKDRLARLLVNAGQVPQAEKVADELVKLQPAPGPLILAGDIALLAGKGAVAEAHYRRALSLSPNLVTAEIGIGRALEKQGKYDDARVLLEKAAERAPNDPLLWAALGSTYRRANRFTKAVEAHERVVKLLPSSAQGHLLLGADHFATGEWDEAIRDYTAATKADPTNQRAKHLLNLVLVKRAQTKIRRKLLDEAVLDLRRAYDVERSPETGLLLAAVLLEEKKNGEADRITDELAKDKNPSWLVYLLRTYSLIGTGRAQQALDAVEEAKKLANAGGHKDPKVMEMLAVAWSLAKIETGDYETAISKLNEFTGGNSESTAVVKTNLARAYVKLGWKKLEAGDVAAAAKELEAARSLNPKGALANAATLLHAMILVDARKTGQALEAVKSALGSGRITWADPATRPLIEAYIHYRAGQIAQAKKVLTNAKKVIPATGPIAAWVGKLQAALSEREARDLVAKGQFVPAEALFKKLLSADPQNPILQHNAGVAAYRRGDTARAVSVWTQLEASVPEALYNLGVDEEVRRHQPRAAMTHYQKYLANARGGADRRELKDSIERLQRIYGGGGAQ